MLKHVYRVIILLCVFLGSVYYFGLGMTDKMFIQNKTIEMSEASFPVVVIKLDEDMINLLHGYSNNMNANMMRESITPLDENQSIMVYMDENGNDVKRVIIELREISDNKLIETDTINALEMMDGYKTASVKIKTLLEEGNEYILKTTLVTSESRKMNYYTRVKKVANSGYKMKLDFVMNIHNSLLDDSKKKDVESYFEPSKNADDSSFAKVNINSSYDMVTYGSLNPKVISDIIPTITDISSEIGMVKLTYVIEVETEYGTEQYNVNEYFRVRYAVNRMFLLGYERTMESIFNMNNISLSQNELKVGITNHPEVDAIASADKTKVAFVRERDLWYYDIKEGVAVRIFSFRQEDTDFIRDNYDKHEVKILSMNDSGNVNFLVYGYMNRGAYEGKVGIILYEYHHEDHRIEEMVYIPSNTPYDMLKEDMKDFSYVSSNDIYYFYFHNSIYAFNMITKNLEIIQSDITEMEFIYLPSIKYIAIQESKDLEKSTFIRFIELETGNEQKINTKGDLSIKLLGKIDNNILVGYLDPKDITQYIDGSSLAPMQQVSIVDYKGKVLKTYKKDGYYISDITVNQNVVTLGRMTKSEESGKVVFKSTTSDNILNKLNTEVLVVGTNQRVTDKMKTEYYLFLPPGTKLSAKPTIEYTENTVIRGDTTLRIDTEESTAERYVVYAYGSMMGSANTIGEAVVLANETSGSVLDHSGMILWERKVRVNTIELSGITIKGGDSKKASADMLIEYRFGEDISRDKSYNNMNQYLKEYLGDSVLNLTGAGLSDVLYYVTLKQPVVAMKNEKDAVLIIGYDPFNITVIDPSIGRSMKIGLNDSTAMFKAAGNIFFTYQGKTK